MKTVYYYDLAGREIGWIRYDGAGWCYELTHPEPSLFSELATRLQDWVNDPTEYVDGGPYSEKIGDDWLVGERVSRELTLDEQLQHLVSMGESSAVEAEIDES